jgi:hypothetical protein
MMDVVFILFHILFHISPKCYFEVGVKFLRNTWTISYFNYCWTDFKFKGVLGGYFILLIITSSCFAE